MIFGRPHQYVLGGEDGHTPIPEPDILKWCRQFEISKRIVAQSHIGLMRVFVSTVFLGLDHNHNFDDPEPVLFETMIFNGPHDQDMWRYHTWDEALEGHMLAVAMVEQTPWYEWARHGLRWWWLTTKNASRNAAIAFLAPATRIIKRWRPRLSGWIDRSYSWLFNYPKNK